MKRAALVALLILVPAAVRGQAPAASSPIFVFRNSLWPNLHHFLYVLGRARAGAADASRRAVVEAPADRPAVPLTESEQQAWEAAVVAYQNGPSTRDAVFDRTLTAVSRELAAAADAPTLEGRALDPGLRAALERAAPVYRKGWWDRHRAANRDFIGRMQTWLARHGAAVRERVTAAYGREWPAAGRTVEICGYANWAGAYSTTGGLLVVSSLDAGLHGSLGFEMLFHEAIHQWDDEVLAWLDEEARRLDLRLPGNLTHALIFYTAGHAVAAEVAGHIPYAEVNGMWNGRQFGPFKEALDTIWRPWLEKTSTLGAARTALVRAAGLRRSRGLQSPP